MSAYNDGVRIFLEMGPGASCSRMIGQILEDRPHLARSPAHPGQDGEGALLRLLASLVAERVPVDLSPLFAAPPAAVATGSTAAMVTVSCGGRPFAPPLPPVEKPAAVLPATAGAPACRSRLCASRTAACQPDHAATSHSLALTRCCANLPLPRTRNCRRTQAYLRFSDSITQSMAQALSLEHGAAAGAGG